MSDENELVSDDNKLVSKENKLVSDENELVSDENKLVSDDTDQECCSPTKPKIIDLPFDRQYIIFTFQYYAKLVKDAGETPVSAWTIKYSDVTVENIQNLLSNLQRELKNPKQSKCDKQFFTWLNSFSDYCEHLFQINELKSEWGIRVKSRIRNIHRACTTKDEYRKYYANLSTMAAQINKALECFFKDGLKDAQAVYNKQSSLLNNKYFRCMILAEVHFANLYIKRKQDIDHSVIMSKVIEYIFTRKHAIDSLAPQLNIDDFFNEMVSDYKEVRNQPCDYDDLPLVLRLMNVYNKNMEKLYVGHLDVRSFEENRELLQIQRYIVEKSMDKNTAYYKVYDFKEKMAQEIDTLFTDYYEDQIRLRGEKCL